MQLRKPIALFLLATAAVTALAQKPAAVKVGELAFMAGVWVGQDGPLRFEEHWMEPAGGAMLSMSRTMVKDRMVAFEFLRVETRADGIYYVAQPGGRPPTAFKLTKSTANSAVFENPQNDHPKAITYRLDGPDKLTASIEGEEKGRHKFQEFHFLRAAK
jgi:Domain of unknown function (DUF6265)